MRALPQLSIVFLVTCSLVACGGASPGSSTDTMEGDGGPEAEAGAGACAALDCGDHGACVEAAEGALCLCDPGWDGRTCGRCAPGFGQSEDDACAPRLSEARPEPAGDACAAGGVAALSGLDLDGNGRLDATEIDETTYVCAAEPSTAPVPCEGEDCGAPERLVETAPEPRGAQCPVSTTRCRRGTPPGVRHEE